MWMRWCRWWAALAGVLAVVLPSSTATLSPAGINYKGPCRELETNSGIECPRPPGADGNFVNFYCSKDNEYNGLAAIFFNTQDDAMRSLFSAKTFHEYNAQSLITFLYKTGTILLHSHYHPLS
ncbi:hypothetical protein GUJ93_ZPchr0009g1553 [Zizania palustris]|uniref:Wall-associated receptor kinase galacturonan-binding domain-containing protein n=1 Tax=Zizania palustris TaxID=103762 RepID=A0A8J5RBG6_ZIZPA|nr:hypothetical protein GUJ93_ZPchr0009g1553 [Zizania palustris]